MTKCFHEVKS